MSARTGLFLLITLFIANPGSAQFHLPSQLGRQLEGSSAGIQLKNSAAECDDGTADPERRYIQPLFLAAGLWADKRDNRPYSHPD